MHTPLFCTRLTLAWLTLLLAACASPVPQAIREAPADAPSLETVHAGAEDYLGQRVRWGGTLVETTNREEATWLTVLGRPLGWRGKPDITDESAGRFIAIVPEFLDPELYASGRRVTVTGTLLRTDAGRVGEYPYTYPVVQAEAWYLWPLEPYWSAGSPYPGWYDPWGYPYWFNDPWYPYGYRYPYWR